MGQIAKAQAQAVSKEPQTINDFIRIYSNEIKRALPKVITPERFTRIAMNAIRMNPKLGKCDPQSFIGSLMNAAQLGLEPNTPLGQAYLIPYGIECQFQIGYKGMIELARRSGEVKSIEAHVVNEGDEFEFEYGLGANLKHKPSMTGQGAPIWVYALIQFKDGGYAFEVMSYEACLAHGRKYSKAFTSGPWKTEPEEMAKKTVLKKVLKYAPMRTEFVMADEQSFRFNKNTGEIEVIPTEAVEVSEDGGKTEPPVNIDPAAGEIYDNEYEVVTGE